MRLPRSTVKPPLDEGRTASAISGSASTTRTRATLGAMPSAPLMENVSSARTESTSTISLSERDMMRPMLGAAYRHEESGAVRRWASTMPATSWTIARPRSVKREGTCVNASFFPYSKNVPSSRRRQKSEMFFTMYVASSVATRNPMDHSPYSTVKSHSTSTLPSGVSSRSRRSARSMNAAMQSEDTAERSRRKPA